jgi:hypothetical protein
MSGASLATGARRSLHRIPPWRRLGGLRAGSKPATANVLDLANEATLDDKEAVTSVATGFALS